jgi:hypothetical protein
MCLSDDGRAAIHEYKQLLGLDSNAGNGIAQEIGIPKGKAKKIVEDEMNPVIEDVIAEFCPGRR